MGIAGFWGFTEYLLRSDFQFRLWYLYIKQIYLKMYGVSVIPRNSLRSRMGVLCNGIQVTDLRKRYYCANNNDIGGLYACDLKYYFPSPTNSLERYHKEDVNVRMRDIKVSYPSGMKDCVRIVKGERLEQDVLALLSNGGKRDYLVRNNGDKVAVDSLAGKYLLICCFKVPLPRKSLADSECRSMIALYSELVNNTENNFEMVMVAKMAAAAEEDEEEAAFNHFFQAFPCLAIPFWDTESRDFVCKSLGLTHPYKHSAALVLDPDQMVLQMHTKYRFYDFFFMMEYGASGFPYNDERLDAILCEDAEIKGRLDYFYNYAYDYGSRPDMCSPPVPAVSLEQLLGISDHLLSRFGNGDKIRVSELIKKKCVVFYLCLAGSNMHVLESRRKRHVAENLEFEVVLVHIPFYSDATSYVKAVEAALERHELSSWWVMPAVNDDNRRLFRLSGMCRLLPLRDEWIFVADGNSGELRGSELMDSFLSEVELYPYSRKVMLDDILCRIRSVTIDSMLGCDNQLILSSDSDSTSRWVNVSELKGKNVLVYFDYYDAIIEGRSCRYQLVLDSYEQIQKDYPNSQVVFVPLDEKVPQNTPIVPWLALPHSAAVMQGSVIRLLFPYRKQSVIIAFGDDGCVRSISACNKLEDEDEDNNVDGHSLFDDTLFEEIFDCLRSYDLDNRSRF